MKKHIPTLLVTLGAAALLGTACSSHRARPVAMVVPENQIVVEAPPEPKPELPGVAPGESYMWMSGYWGNINNRWVWVPGHWERSRPGAVWVAGRWDKTDKGWAWIPGRWQPTASSPTAVGGAEQR